MTTREPSLPGELSLVSLGPATVTNGASIPSGSPGVGLAATRVPSGPTLPDVDPASLTLAISRYVNDLYAAPPAAPESPSPTQAPSTPSAPAPVAAPHSAPTQAQPNMQQPAVDRAPAARSPFDAALDFDSLTAAIQAATPEVLRVSLLDERAPSQHQAQPPAKPAHTPAAPRPIAYEVTPETALELPAAGGPIDAHALKKEFPILDERVHGKQLVWLDNAATTQKPRAVIERLKTYYERENSNIHRAAHALAARATDAYEAARESVRRFVNAASVKDVVFVRGTTEGINLVAQSWGSAQRQRWGRPDRRDALGASREHRSVEMLLRREGREAARRPCGQSRADLAR